MQGLTHIQQAVHCCAVLRPWMTRRERSVATCTPHRNAHPLSGSTSCVCVDIDATPCTHSIRCVFDNEKASTSRTVSATLRPLWGAAAACAEGYVSTVATVAPGGGAGAGGRLPAVVRLAQAWLR